MRRSQAVYKRTCKIHGTCPFALMRRLYIEAATRERERERESRSIASEYRRTLLRAQLHPWCPVICTKSYYLEIDVCKCRQLQFGFVRGDDRSFSRATTPLLFMKRSNLWLFIFAVFVECLFVEFHYGLKR